MDVHDWRAESTESLLEELANLGILEITATSSGWVGMFRDGNGTQTTSTDRKSMHLMLAALMARVST